MDLRQLLLLSTPGIPLLLAAFWPVARRREVLVAVAPWAAVPALILALHPGAEGAEVMAPMVFTGLHFALDATGRAFLLLTALLWVAAGAFARSYHAEDPRRDTFFGFFVLTMSGNLGLVVAGDVLSFYLFFALMTFAAYGLVVHRRSGEARRAGRIYIVMAILGELCLLAMLLSLGWGAQGVPAFGQDLEGAWSALERVGWETGVAGLAVAGFGVKAGIVLLHLWLPLAHPVAPTAASALLSGAMIEAGVLGWLRHLPSGLALPEVGTPLAIFGVVSMFYGVAVGLAQDDAKTVLAYSSMSQMGYMALGVGLLLQASGWGAVGLLAVVFFAVHHGMAKAALFLTVGVADRIPGGGASRRIASVPVIAALPALVLAGGPLTTGAMAKGALESGLREVAPGWYGALHPVLLAASVATTLLMARFLVTLRDRMDDPGLRGEVGNGARRSGSGRAGPGLVAPWIVLVALGVTGGLWLPSALSAPTGAALPGVSEGGVAAGLPVLTGVLIGTAIWRRPELLGRLRDLRLPPGDLVVLFEALARRLRRLPWGMLEEKRGAGVVQAVRRVQLWVHARAGWAAERDINLARGPVVGLVLTGLAVALVLALSLG